MGRQLQNRVAGHFTWETCFRQLVALVVSRDHTAPLMNITPRPDERG